MQKTGEKTSEAGIFFAVSCLTLRQSAPNLPLPLEEGRGEGKIY
jgi:hypothetical protein